MAGIAGPIDQKNIAKDFFTFSIWCNKFNFIPKVFFNDFGITFKAINVERSFSFMYTWNEINFHGMNRLQKLVCEELEAML